MTELNEAFIWREKTARLKQELTNLVKEGKIKIEDIAEFVRAASGAVLRHEKFISPFKDRAEEAVFETLYQYIQLSMTDEGAIVLIPMQVVLIQSKALNLEEFIEYLHECVTIIKNIEDVPGSSAEDGGEMSETEVRFNLLLDEIEELAENEEYELAIKKVDEAFDIAGNESLFFYDKVTMINNRAFYNCQLGNFEHALEDANMAIKEDPTDALPYYTKSEILVALNRLEEALESITKAIELDDSEDKQEYRKMILEKL